MARNYVRYYDDEPIDPDVEPWDVDPDDYNVTYVFLAAYVVAFVWLFWTGRMMDWGLSAAALRAGHFDTVFLHMFAHANLTHIFFNGWAILSLGPLVASLLGRGIGRDLRFAGLLLGAGIAGGLFFLAVHPHGTVPMVGASGGLFGFLGALARVPTQHGPLTSIRSPETRLSAWHALAANLWPFLIFGLPALILGTGGGLAWEAHLGGFIFGLLAMPWFYRPRPLMPAKDQAEAEPA